MADPRAELRAAVPPDADDVYLAMHSLNRRERVAAGDRVRAELAGLRAELEAAHDEATAAKLTNEQHLQGNVDPVDVIAAISGECLSNRAELAEARRKLDELSRDLDSQYDAWEPRTQASRAYRDGWGAAAAAVRLAASRPTTPVDNRRYDQCDDTCTVDCGHCKGNGPPSSPVTENSGEHYDLSGTGVEISVIESENSSEGAGRG